MQNLIERPKTVPEVAAWLQKTPQVIEQMARRKQLPAFKVGKSGRFDPAALTEWIARQQEAK
jgi:excisionase family DNA binding protein